MVIIPDFPVQVSEIMLLLLSKLGNNAGVRKVRAKFVRLSKKKQL